MRIIIDLQGAQSGSRFRGIGRYSVSLAVAMVRNRGNHEIIIVLSGLFPETIDSLYCIFSDMLPQKFIRIWYAPCPVSEINASNDCRRETAEVIRESFIASLHPDYVLITSLFEGLGDNAITTVHCFDDKIPTAVILYDLIPMIYSNDYLTAPHLIHWYEKKISYLKKANILLAISDSAQKEGIAELGLKPSEVVNISSATDEFFNKIEIDPTTAYELCSRFGLSKSFLMYTGGVDYRKNVEGLIRAYALLSIDIRRQHQLVIVCAIENNAKRRLAQLGRDHGLEPDEVILTGFVSENDLKALYNLCKAFVFPSWHEGFGLPALEAMNCGAAVIGSNTSSLPEVIGNPDALFDPRSDESIATKIAEVLTDETFRSSLRSYAREHIKNFSWDKSACFAISAIEKSLVNNVKTKTSSLNQRPRLAYVSPLLPDQSGIATYSAMLLPVLSCYYDIEIIVGECSDSSVWNNSQWCVLNAEWLKNNADNYDRVLYHMGISKYHSHMFDLINVVPGVVVLHDFYLSNIIAHMDAQLEKGHFWARSLYFSHGYRALEERFNTADIESIKWKYPCNLSLTSAGLGIIVHSASSIKLAERWIGKSEADSWSIIPMLSNVSDNDERIVARKRLNIDENTFVVCSFGLISFAKLSHRVLEGWVASGAAADQKSCLIFVGESANNEYGRHLRAQIKKSKLADRIIITGWTSNEIFSDYLKAADLGIQLRTHSRGETSLAVIECMANAIPTIVNANGSMADLPMNCTYMLPDNFSSEELSNALDDLWINKDLRCKLGMRARAHIQQYHNPESCSFQYFEAIEKYYTGKNSNTKMLCKALTKLPSAGLSPNNDLAALAHAIAMNESPKGNKQLLLDVSNLISARFDKATKLKEILMLKELINSPPIGYRIEPVYAIKNKEGYYYARKFMLKMLNCPLDVLADEPIDASVGDKMVLWSVADKVVNAQLKFIGHLMQRGVLVFKAVPGSHLHKSTWSALRRIKCISDSGSFVFSDMLNEPLSTWLNEDEINRLFPLQSLRDSTVAVLQPHLDTAPIV